MLKQVREYEVNGPAAVLSFRLAHSPGGLTFGMGLADLENSLDWEQARRGFIRARSVDNSACGFHSLRGPE